MKPELLAPVSNWPSLHAAIEAGADAVYFGVNKLNMRIPAKNFSLADIPKITKLCKQHKVKAYLTLNTIIYEKELKDIQKILKKAKQSKIDAIICWDLSVIQAAKKLKLNIHISTQASISNTESAKFYKKLGAKRIILARECILKDIKKISKIIPVETFIHGAMCVSISGRCFLSQEIFKKSANRGECLQPCRREYQIQDTEREYKLKVGNNYILSPKDLCTLPIIDKLIKAGISSFKIEGRNRSPEYVKTTTEVYREAIDLHSKKRLTKEKKKELIKRLKTVYNRDFHTGFFLGTPTADDFTEIYGSKATVKKKYVGIVKNYFGKVNVAEIKLEASDLNLDDTIMFQGPTTGVFEQKVNSMQINKKLIKKAKKGQSFGLKVKRKVRKNDKLFLMTHKSKNSN